MGIREIKDTLIMFINVFLNTLRLIR